MSAVKGKAREVGLLTLALTAVLVAAWFILRDGIWPQRIAPEVPEPVVERLGPAPEGDEAARSYAKLLREEKYNAAFAINATGGYGWGDYFARIEDAERFALAQCGKAGPGCRIVLRIVPETPVAFEGLPLSRTAATALAAYPARERSKAIALTGHGGWGGAWNRRSKREAIQIALEQCRKHETTTAPGLEITTQCRVIWAD